MPRLPEKDAFSVFSSSLFKLSILLKILFLALEMEVTCCQEEKYHYQEKLCYSWCVSTFLLKRCFMVFYLLCVFVSKCGFIQVNVGA